MDGSIYLTREQIDTLYEASNGDPGIRPLVGIEIRGTDRLGDPVNMVAVLDGKPNAISHARIEADGSCGIWEQ